MDCHIVSYTQCISFLCKALSISNPYLNILLSAICVFNNVLETAYTKLTAQL